MYSIFKNVIESGNYELSDILNKIDTKWLENALTDDERVELMRLAREKAIAENSYANADKRFEDIYRQLSEMNNAIKELTAKVNANNEESGEEIEPEVPVDGYPEYKAPTGAHDAYFNGAKVTYNGKKYVCVAPEGVAVVWNPDVMPSYWELVE